MKAELEAKYIYPYLDYELKCNLMGVIVKGTEHDDNPKPAILTITGISKMNDGTVFIQADDEEYHHEHEIDEVFPILRPLSDLNIKKLSEYYKDLMDADLERVVYEIKQWPLLRNYLLCQWLFENHFDVFGLIDKGLAINKNN